MDSKVKNVRGFVVSKLMAARRTMKREEVDNQNFPDPYRRGFCEALAMVQSYIDKVAAKEVPDEK